MVDGNFNGGRIVARFRPTQAETEAAAAAMLPKLVLGTGLNKRLLILLGFAAGAAIALGKDYWPSGWTQPVSLLLYGLIIGAIAAISIIAWLGRRQKRLMQALAGSSEDSDVTIHCQENGVSWVSPGLAHYLPFQAIDEARITSGECLLRHRLFVFHVPARGFVTAADRAYLVDALRRQVGPDRFFTDGTEAQG